MQDRAEVIAMIKEMGLFANKNYAATRTLEERQEQITGLITTIKQHPAGTPELLAEAQKLKLRMDTYYRQLFGNEEKDKRWFMTEPGINNRLQRAFFGTLGGTHGPTKTTKDQWQIAKTQWEEIEADLLNLIGDEMEAFEKAVDEAGIPWTTGRDQP
jgi:hypothetical protein